MATATQVNQEVQDRVLDTLRVGQKAVVDFVRSWSETVEATFSRLPELTMPEQPLKPSQTFESAFGFTERVFAAQREFASQLFDAAVPATRAASGAASQAAQTAKNATR